MNYKQLLSVVGGCAAFAAALSSQPAADDPVRIGFTVPGTPVIDGEIDALWDIAPRHDLDNFIPFERTEEPTPETHSGWWKSMYDDEYLYILVVVFDDHLVPSTPRGFFDADVINVYMSGTYHRMVPGFGGPGMDWGDYDYNLFFGLGAAAGVEEEIATGLYSTPFWWPELGGVDYAQAPNPYGEGYVMEIRIAIDPLLVDEYSTDDFRDAPVATDFYVDASNFESFRKIGFEIHSTDNDSGEDSRDSKLAWANYVGIFPSMQYGPDPAWAVPRTWGTLIFADIDDGAADYLDHEALHWIYYYGYGSGWAKWYADFSGADWGYLYIGSSSWEIPGWAYHQDQGWVYFLEGSAHTYLMAYVLDLGWIVASEAFANGHFYRYETETFEPWVQSEP